jgi:hypothetical protein
MLIQAAVHGRSFGEVSTNRSRYRVLLAASVSLALGLSFVAAEGDEPRGWHLVDVPVLCARYSTLADGLQAMINGDIDAAIRAGCFIMKQPLAVRLVGEYDNGRVAKVAYKGRDGREHAAWTLRAFVKPG